MVIRQNTWDFQETTEGVLATAYHFPGAVADGKTRHEAFDKLVDVVAVWMDTSRELGREITDGQREVFEHLKRRNLREYFLYIGQFNEPYGYSSWADYLNRMNEWQREQTLSRYVILFKESSPLDLEGIYHAKALGFEEVGFSATEALERLIGQNPESPLMKWLQRRLPQILEGGAIW